MMKKINLLAISLLICGHASAVTFNSKMEPSEEGVQRIIRLRDALGIEKLINDLKAIDPSIVKKVNAPRNSETGRSYHLTMNSITVNNEGDKRPYTTDTFFNGYKKMLGLKDLSEEKLKDEMTKIPGKKARNTNLLHDKKRASILWNKEVYEDSDITGFQTGGTQNAKEFKAFFTLKQKMHEVQKQFTALELAPVGVARLPDDGQPKGDAEMEYIVLDLQDRLGRSISHAPKTPHMSLFYFSQKDLGSEQKEKVEATLKTFFENVEAYLITHATDIKTIDFSRMVCGDKRLMILDAGQISTGQE